MSKIKEPDSGQLMVLEEWINKYGSELVERIEQLEKLMKLNKKMRVGSDKNITELGEEVEELKKALIPEEPTQLGWTKELPPYSLKWYFMFDVENRDYSFVQACDVDKSVIESEETYFLGPIDELPMMDKKLEGEQDD